MTIKDFAVGLAALPFNCVATRYADLPKRLKREELPASWFEMPTAIVGPDEDMSTFGESGASYSGLLFIAVAEKQEGFPAEQQTAVLDAAVEVELWARQMYYRAEITTAATINVGAVEYRGVGARITAPALE